MAVYTWDSSIGNSLRPTATRTTWTPSWVHAATLLQAFSFTALFPSSFFLGQGLNYSYSTSLTLLLLTARAKTPHYSTSGFYLGLGLKKTYHLYTQDSSLSSSTPAHPIRILTCLAPPVQLWIDFLWPLLKPFTFSYPGRWSHWPGRQKRRLFFNVQSKDTSRMLHDSP